jgi:hypothetical protein
MMTKFRVYISGPMTGQPEFNFPAFHETAARLRQAGAEAINPAESFGGRTDLPRASYIRADMVLLAHCQAIVMLPGWENSRGAKLEYLMAREIGMPVFDAETFQALKNPPVPSVNLHQIRLVRELPEETVEEAAPESVLAEAMRITDGARHADYGHPRDDFARTALMWTGILAGKLREDVEVTAADVPLCMIAVKLARQSHRHKRDNLVDIAGYARTAAMVAGDE